MTQYETEAGRPKSAAKIPISLAGKPNLGDGTITNIQTRPDTTMWSVHRNQTHFVESSLSKLVIKENSQDMEVMEKAMRRELRNMKKDKADDDERENLALHLKKFNQDLKEMRHKLRCIGGTDEKHIIVSNKGKTEIDVIPNTYVYIRIPV